MSPSPSILIIGASRGLGLALTQYYSSQPNTTIYATVRSPPKAGTFPDGVKVIEGIDVSEEEAGKMIVEGLKGGKVGVVIVVAGVLKPEKPGQPSWEDQLEMYKICSMAPVFIANALASSGSFADSAKVIFLTSEGGSLALRTQSEGSGMYGHHASKAAGNMIGKLLGHEYREQGVAVAMIHPGFLKTEMTKGAGFDEFYESGGAVTPEEACPGIMSFIEGLEVKDTGKFWAVNGVKSIGSAEQVLSKEDLEKDGPVELPW